MKISCIIVEDEPVSRLVLERFCQKHPGLSLSASFPAAEPALDFLKTHETDIVFLDIQLPGINGFEFLDQVPFMPKVILTTNDTGYAFTAFQYHVADYLKKPFSYPRFEAAINKARDGGLAKKSNPPEDVFIRSEGRYIRLNYTDILYVESMGDYVKYVTADGGYITHSTFKNAVEKLPGELFMKIHRCYIVNLKRVSDVADNHVWLGSTEIPVSKAVKSVLLQRLNILH